MPSRPHFKGKKKGKVRGVSKMRLDDSLQVSDLNKSFSENVDASNIINCHEAASSTFSYGAGPSRIKEPRLDADIGSSIESCEASCPDANLERSVPPGPEAMDSSSRPRVPSSRPSMNVAAVLESLQDDGDDFNLDGYEFDEDAEEAREPLLEALSTIEKKMAACPTPLEVDPSAGSYELIHSSFLEQLLSSVGCPSCEFLGLKYVIPLTKGMASKIEVSCENCNSTQFTGYTSPLAGKRRDINVRTVLGSRESGISHPRLKTLFAIMNLPVPLASSTYDTISQEVHLTSLAAAEAVQKEAAAYITGKYNDGTFTPLNKKQSELGYPVNAVTFDGAWQTRGFSSHTGIGVAIDLETGLVLDTETLSNFCTGCLAAPEVDTLEFKNWKREHGPRCSNNHQGSSGSMEMVAAERIFNRSIEKLQLLYGTMLSDGDGKAHEKIKCIASYDIEVEKEDCVNHIAKRMHNGLVNLKSSDKGRFNRRLTTHMIAKITNTYATNLRRGAPDVDLMRQCVWGGMFHMAATDATPENHRHCPKGLESWCGYQRAIAKNEPPPKHKWTFSIGILQAIMPVVTRLVDPALLKRCARMLTQNNNESFNSTVWKRAPKTEYRGKRSVQTAVALATLNFNCGSSGITRVLGPLNLQLNQRLKDYIDARTACAVKSARTKQKHLSKWKRKALKLVNRTRDQKRVASEGVTYEAGAFAS